MYEEGGGQMTCYWYVLISLKLFLIVCICRNDLKLSHRIYDFLHISGKKLLFFSVPWNLWNFMKSGGVFKRPFWRKKLSKSKPIFSTTQNGLAHAQRGW